MKEASMSEIIAQQSGHHGAQARWDWNLWFRWVLANAIGEVVGLGTAAVVGVGLAWTIEKTMGAFGSLAMAGVMILVGTLEGIVVGIAQWLVLRRPIQNMSWRVWVLATAIGAFVAWTLGMIPSTLMATNTAAAAAAAPPPEMSDVVMYGLAALMGAVLGPILGLPQWLVLRRHVQKAGWWVLANAAAWALGMPVVFVGASSVPPGGFGLGVVVVGIVTGASAGAVVGAVHGLALVWLLQSHHVEA